MIARNDRSEHQSGRFAGKTVQSIHDVYPRLLILALQADSSETQTTRIEITVAGEGLTLLATEGTFPRPVIWRPSTRSHSHESRTKK